MYQPAITYTRTPAECRDQKLSWGRNNQAFFAAGACHILAFVLVAESKQSNLQINFIKPLAKFWPIGTHVYVSDGERAFDFNGWVLEEELLRMHTSACEAQCPSWSGEVLTVTDNLKTFCIKNKHLLPQDFYGDVFVRAQAFIATINQK